MRCTLRRPATLPCACSARSLAAASLSSQKPSLINPQRLTLTLTSTSTSLLKISSLLVARLFFSSCLVFIKGRALHLIDRTPPSSSSSLPQSPSPSTSPIFAHSGKESQTRATSLAAPPSETRDKAFFPGTSPSLFSPTTT